MTQTARQARFLLSFQKPSDQDDGFGTVTNNGPFVEQFKAWAVMSANYFGAGESVLAQKLVGVQPYAVKIRANPRSRLVDMTWRAVKTDNSEFNIKTVSENASNRNWLDITMTRGVPT